MENTQEKMDQIGTDHGKRFTAWTFPEFPEHERGKVWYIVGSVIVLALIISAILTRNYLFAVFIAMATFIYILRLQRKPRLVTFAITEDGLEVHESFYSYKDINKFWLVYDPPEIKTLYFSFKSAIRPTLTIPLESQNPIAIRDLLLKFVEEDLERDDESTSDALQRTLKF